jgi:hypothetical protein
MDVEEQRVRDAFEQIERNNFESEAAERESCKKEC